METTSHKSFSPVITGLLAGLASGLLSGLVLQQLWVLTPLSILLGIPPNPASGWAVHLGITALFGLLFAIVSPVFNQDINGLIGAGLLTGIILWILGPLFLIPILLGLPPQFYLFDRWLTIGLAYAIYGLGLGVTYAIIHFRLYERRSRI